MFKFALIAAAIGGGVYFVAKSMTKPPSSPSSPSASFATVAANVSVLAGAANTAVSTVSGWFRPAPAKTTSEPNASTGFTSRTVAGQTPYGTTSTQDGDAAISDAMGVAAARSVTPYPNLFQTRAQAVFSGAAIAMSPFSK
jgi:hypothetical protein